MTACYLANANDFSTPRIADIPRLLRHSGMSREEIVTFQEQRLRAIVRHAYANVLYYRRLLDEAGVKPEEIRGIADLPRIPITTKATLQALGGTDMIARGLSRSSLVTRQTNGSTGIPLTVYRLPAEQLLPALFLSRVRRSFGLTHGTRATALVKRSYRARSRSRLSRLTRQVKRLGGARKWTRIDSTLPMDQVAELVRETNPEVISGYTGVLTRLAHYVAGHETEIRPRLIASTAELLTPTMRSAIESAFGTPVRDTYSCYELGLIAWECPAGGTYHVCDDNAIVEIEREDGKASGELIGTSLHFAAMPIIRYRLGDIVTRGPDRCACGSPFSTLSWIEGRTIDYFSLPDDSLLHPHLIAGAVWERGFAWMHQYQVVQERRDRVVMRIIPKREPTREEIADVERAGGEVVGPQVQFVHLLVEEIPDAPSGKFCAYRSLVKLDNG
jgi:phenylacetate-CoA ligase